MPEKEKAIQLKTIRLQHKINLLFQPVMDGACASHYACKIIDEVFKSEIIKPEYLNWYNSLPSAGGI